jgi:iron complex transport system substrate-binding protein
MPRLLAALAGLLIAAGAAAQSQRLTDGAGRQVTVPAKVERVYAAGPPASMLVFAIAPDKLIGWTRAFRPNEAAFVAPKYGALPELGRLTGRGSTANVEVLLQSKTDLVVDAGSTADTFVSLADRVQQQTGIPYLLMDGRIDAMPGSLRTLGRALGDEKRGAQLADYVEAALKDVKARVAQVKPEERPRVYYGRGPAGLQTGLAGSINVELLEYLGARNVAAESKGGLAQVSLEQVLAWNPEVILTTDPNFYAAIWNDARWQGVAAVKAKRVHLAPHLPFGWFDFPPGVNRILGLYWAGLLLYPKAFPADLRPRVTEFHRQFYHQAPTAAQLDALLGEPGVLPK